MVNKNLFWKNTTLDEMTPKEWEMLCDGCGICCLHKIEDCDTGEVFYTDVACRLLDLETCQCKDYEHRMQEVSDCAQLTPEMVREISWLPESCAYRRLAEGRELPWWHPLISGNRQSVIHAGISILGKVVEEEDIDLSDLEDRVVDWFDG